MKRFYLIILLILLFITSGRPQKIVVGYINGYYSTYPISAIDFGSLTHIAHAFIYPTENGSLKIDSWFLYPQLIQAAHQHGVKVIVALGGFGGGDAFSPMCADSTARAKFVNNLVNFIKTYNYDGADLDWEYPGSADRNNYTALVTELREAFDKNNIEILTAAVPIQDWANGYDIPKLKDKFNWIGIMSYDVYGPWENTSGHNSPLYPNSRQTTCTERGVQYYLGRGMPAEKICIGMAFGGYNLNTSGLYQTNSGGSSISYLDANAKISQGWEYHWDDAAKAPYLQNPTHTQLITYDDTTSLKLKCEYIQMKKLKGTIIWKIGRDYSGGKTPLLNLMGKYLLHPPTLKPLIPIPDFPANNEKLDTTVVNFKWKSTDSTFGYGIQLSKDSNFTQLILSKSKLSFPEFMMNNLIYNTRYYWRVNSSNTVGYSDWSEAQTFTTKSLFTFVEEGKLNPGKYEITNYPNPFNPNTTIKYSLPEAAKVKIDVFNILGIKVQTLVDETKSAGKYTVDFRAGNLVSGVYLCRIQTRNFTKITKMILMK